MQAARTKTGTQIHMTVEIKIPFWAKSLVSICAPLARFGVYATTPDRLADLIIRHTKYRIS